MSTADQLHSTNDELSITDPTTGELVGNIRISSPEEVAEAVSRAQAAQQSWAKQDPADRGSYLHKMADALSANLDELARLNQVETGKLPADCTGGIEAGIGTLRQYAELGPLQRGHSLRGGLLAADYTIRRPRGVVAALTPWNDPVAVAMGILGAAIVTGNTVVHKPSERNPHLGQRLGEILAEVLPRDVLVTVTGAAEVGQQLTSDERIAVFAHVGSTAAGKDIMKTAAESGAHVVLENGGNDALIVDESVSPTWAAAQAALGCFANAGQICTSVERIYVMDSIAEEFILALQQEAKEWSSADRRQPLVDQRQRSHVADQVNAAVSAGAQLVTGGELPDTPGAYYPATVLTDCTAEMAIMREETFGPVAPVQTVSSFDQALQLADDSRYGLAATVLTSRVDRTLQAVAALQVGTVKVNNVFGGAPGGAADPHRDSGTGFGYGPELLDEMTTTSVVHIEGNQ